MSTITIAHMSTPNFRFKRFEVWHDECAMKVGTDAVLLGAWCHPEGAQRVLDIGTGSGVIALMVAQQLEGTDFHIDAIDIDEGAVRQATKNFAISPWSSHLSAHHTSLQHYTPYTIHPTPDTDTVHCTLYTLITSNPPYFQHSLKNPDKGRELARHTDSLRYDELMRYSTALLAPEGALALILPASAEQEVLALAHEYGLAPVAMTHVFSKPHKPCMRLLIKLVRGTARETVCSHSQLILEAEDAPRSKDYAELTKDFYL